jgi:hypothetical protein
MADRLTLQDNGESSLRLLIVDALAFWVRNQAVFWLVALPIAGLGAAIAFVLDRHQQFAGLRNHWGWDFLFALIYAMFLDRWMKITLLDGASPCDEVDNLRRSIIAVRFLVFAACFLLLAMIMSMIRLEGITATLIGWHLPLAVAVPVGTMLSWLPHLFFWATLLALVALMLPSLSAAEPTSLSAAFVLGRPVRAPLFRLVFGSVLLSFATYAASTYGLELMPKKPWSAAVMAGTWRLLDCLLLAVAGYVLATIWRGVDDWRQPEPENHPFRNMKLRVRGPTG